MKKESTSARLKQIMSERDLRQVDILERTLPFCRTYGVKMNKSDISQYVSGKVEPNQDKLFVLSLALNVSEGWLMGFDVSRTRSSSSFSTMQLTDQEEHLVISFRGLNEDGREKAVERVEELLDVPRYRMDAVSTRIWQDAEKVDQEKLIAYGEGLAAAGTDDAEREVDRIVAQELAAAKKSIAK